jgi:hypothetical protein
MQAKRGVRFGFAEVFEPLEIDSLQFIGSPGRGEYSDDYYDGCGLLRSGRCDYTGERGRHNNRLKHEAPPTVDGTSCGEQGAI